MRRREKREGIQMDGERGTSEGSDSEGRNMAETYSTEIGW